jgi:hypothetical protein
MSRRGVLLAVAAALLLAGGPGPATAGGPVVPNRATDYAPADQPWLACGLERALDVRLDGPARPYHVEWRRCGPPQARWRPDGKTIEYPTHFVVVTRGAGAPLAVFDNREEPELSYIESVRAMRFTADGREQLLVVSGIYGTGAAWELCALGLVKGALDCWDFPDLGPTTTPQLAADEEIWKSRLVTVANDRLLVEALVYDRNHDANCCPSRGSLFVELRPADGHFEPGRLWRVPGKADR